LLSRRREFVHEAFSHKDIVRRPDAAPEGGRNGRFYPRVFDVHVRKIIREIDCTFGRVGVEAVFEGRRQISRNNRGAREAMIPGNRFSLLIETGRDPVEPIGSVHVVLDIFLAGPYDFHRTVHMHGDLNSPSDAINFEPATKTAAEQVVMHHDLVQRETCGFCRRGLRSRDGLIANPDLAPVATDMNCAVHRLHGRVR